MDWILRAEKTNGHARIYGGDEPKQRHGIHDWHHLAGGRGEGEGGRRRQTQKEKYKERVNDGLEAFQGLGFEVLFRRVQGLGFEVLFRMYC